MRSKDKAGRAAEAIRAAIAPFAASFVEPPVLQPSDVYLELAGEDVRARAYLLSEDGDAGEDLCVRPDMTVPAVRLALAEMPWGAAFGVVYDGLVFRRRDSAHQDGEFRQVGMETFTPRAAVTPEAEGALIRAALEACRSVAVAPRLRLGDVALFAALVDAAALPERWARRFKRAFSRPGGLEAVFKLALAAADVDGGGQPDNALAQAMARMPEADAVQVVAELLRDARMALVGARTVEEIAQRLREKGAREDGKPEHSRVLALQDAVNASGPPDGALIQLEKAVRSFPRAQAADAAIERVRQRCRCVGADTMTFSAAFGGGLAYYDGFVFDLSAGDGVALGGGGRYDGLLQRLSAKAGNTEAGAFAAMGFALRPDRLAEAAP